MVMYEVSFIILIAQKLGWTGPVQQKIKLLSPQPNICKNVLKNSLVKIYCFLATHILQAKTCSEEH